MSAKLLLRRLDLNGDNHVTIGGTTSRKGSLKEDLAALVRVADAGLTLRDLEGIFDSFTRAEIAYALMELRRENAVVQHGKLWKPTKHGGVRKGRARPRAVTISESTTFVVEGEPPLDNSDLLGIARPKTRGDCVGKDRPCPWVSCKWNLYLDVNPSSGSIKLNFPHKEPWDLAETCALDVADRGGITLEEVGDIVNLTRERIRQVEVRGLRALRRNTDLEDEYTGKLEEQK